MLNAESRMSFSAENIQNIKSVFLTKPKTQKVRCKGENFRHDKVSWTGTLSEIGSEMTSLAPVLNKEEKKKQK